MQLSMLFSYVVYAKHILDKQHSHHFNYTHTHTQKGHDLAHLTYLKSLGVPNHMAGQSNAAIIKNHMQNPTFGIICSRSSCIICDERSKYTVPAPKSVNWMHPDTNTLKDGREICITRSEITDNFKNKFTIIKYHILPYKLYKYHMYCQSQHDSICIMSDG